MTLVLHKGISSTLTYNSVSLGSITKFQLTGVKRGTEEIDLIGDQWKKYIGTTTEPGEIEISGFYDYQSSASDTKLMWDMLGDSTGAAHAWVLTSGDGTQTLTGSGILTDFNPSEFNNEKELRYTAKIKNSGAITLAVVVP